MFYWRIIAISIKQGVIALTDQEKQIPETNGENKEPAPDINGPITFPRLGIIIISILLGLIVILAIIIRFLE